MRKVKLLSALTLENEIYNGETETWQYFGVHAPVGDGTFTLQLTPIIDTVGFAAGNETLLNTSIAGDQVPADYAGGASPSQLAALSNGEAVAVWDDENSGQVEARIVTAAGPVGQEITVGSGNDGTVAALANGNFIVVWWDPAANQGLGGSQVPDLFRLRHRRSAELAAFLATSTPMGPTMENTTFRSRV